MAQCTVLRVTSLAILLAVTSSAKEQTRWSRQISSYTSDISDWVPLSGPVEREPPLPPIKRQAVAEPRILTEPFPGLPRPTGFNSDIFPSRTYFNAPANRQLYLQSVPAVPSAPQNYLTDQGFGQSIRFGLSQPNFPLNQGFLSPQFGYEGIQNAQAVPQIRPKPQIQPPVNPVKFDNFQKTPFQVPMSVPVKPFNSQHPKTIPEVPKYVDGYHAENSSVFSYNQKKKPQSLQKIKFETYEKPGSVPRPEMPVPQNIQKPQQSNQKLEREEVQLLYVPLESLNRGQFNFRSPMTSSQILNSDVYSQGVPQVSHKKTVAELHRPVQKENAPNYFSEFNSQFHSQQQKEIDQVPKFSTLSSPYPTSPPTTPKPKKLKPHQPPLAIFLTEDASKNHHIKVGDVLASLKTQNSVPVLDSVNPLNAPKVFIGPSSLQPPERYVKFELPYLSNIENSDKKLRQLPFFVAPLSYNTPQGFAKIPFPSPHVGSVVINSQIKETTTHVPSAENVQPAYYTGTYKQEQQLPQKPATQKPQVSFYTTSSPKTVPQYQSNYYQFEPQTVSTIRPLKEPETVAPPRPGNYFLSNTGTQYNTQFNGQYDPNQYQFVEESYENKPQPPTKIYTAPKIETTTTPRPTSTTTKLPSTYPSQLLETHNPYSINQAFHFSTPLDYRTYTDTDYKEPSPAVATEPQSTPQISVSTTRQPTKEEVVTEPQRYHPQTSPQYQSYSPEIHYESEVQNSRYPTYNTNDYPKTEAPTYSSETYAIQNENNQYNIPAKNPTQYVENEESPTPVANETPAEESKPTISELDNQQKYEYNQYEANFSSNEEPSSSTSTTTTTTTTTRRPLRGRGRPRYTTTPRADSSEYYTRATRRPLRERKPLPTRPRYEPNKITTEKPTRKPIDYSEETTTKSARTRTRGRVTFKPTEEIYDRRKTHNSKEQDLAYQRDVLHQNYPVTIQERHSTVDIEAMTEPTVKQSSNKDSELATESYDTENAYTYERASIAQQTANQDSEDDIPVFPTRTTISQTETSYVPRISTRNEEYIFHSRSSAAPAQTVTYEEPRTEREEESYVKQTTPVQSEPESIAYATESTVLINENKEEESTYNEEETTTTTPEVEVTKEVSHETEEEENVVQTTPSYNRVRVRPGVIKQYHQVSTESSKVKVDRRRPVTYRPAFDRRRTTMRIDEIQQDLKTKQVNGRPETDDYRHPVYKPETSSESTTTQELTTKRGAIRRRRPNYSYTTSSTEGSPVTRKNAYDLKNRFRGRRPTTEKPSEKTTEVPSDITTTTNRPLYSRYSHRPRLSERYSKKPEPQPTEETEDQDSNFSINRPTYTEPDSGKWSPKIASDSFKPYNPNNIVDEEKIATTERRSDKLEMDIITARNEYEDLLISVTPASNNRNNKKIPEIPPTLEALVEQSKVTKSDANDNMSTFESMLEEVMKSLEEQDEDEYSSNVMKHKGGEIGEIPPEKIISSGDAYTKATSPISQDATTVETPTADDSITNEEENDRTTRRRGFWKKVKVRPVATESIEAAESQYYTNTVNMLGQNMEKDSDKPKATKKVTVTTYKPSIQLMKDLFGTDDVTGNDDVIPTVEISKLNPSGDNSDKQKETDDSATTEIKETYTEKNEVSPGEFDLGTGSPDPTMDNLYSTEPITVKAEKQSFSFMDYLFGSASEDTPANKNDTTSLELEITTELAKPKLPTTENTFMPEEITENVDEITEYIDDLKKVSVTTIKEVVTTTTEKPKIETTSQSSFMNPANVISTSMSTEISHETEICFRGKCIKTFKQVV